MNRKHYRMTRFNVKIWPDNLVAIEILDLAIFVAKLRRVYPFPLETCEGKTEAFLLIQPYNPSY